MSELCSITPISAFMSTNLNSKITCFQEMGARILRMLGHPIINVEIHPDQLYDAISMACEMYTKYAGFTKEYLVFDSLVYQHNVGIRLDHLYTVAHTGFNLQGKLTDSTVPNPDFNVELRENLYISLTSLPQSAFSTFATISASIPTHGIRQLQVLDEPSYLEVVAAFPDLSAYFRLSEKEKFFIHCEEQVGATSFNNMFDYDAMDYRKVMDVIDFEEGSTSGITSLFSLEQTLAQQTFYSYAMGNFGFDLLSWHCVKDWQDTREKLLAIRRDVHFDPRTQYLRLYPQPSGSSHFVGVLECYVERPLRDVIKEKWVLEYSVALAKVMWGRILTKITNVQLLGGGSLNGAIILEEGLAEKKELETMIMEGSGGFASYDPIMPFVR